MLGGCAAERNVVSSAAQPAGEVGDGARRRACEAFGGARRILGVVATALDLKGRLGSVFGHSKFRPHQEEVCRRTAAGADGLVVMPTGAGKSLCYQLPGLIRGGPTLVFSPLIALMEDQTAKLRQIGLRAERIHSGRPRHESREACRLYRDGELDFLFISPERLGVPGFIEFWSAAGRP